MSSHAWRNALVYSLVAWTLIAGLCIAGVLADNAFAAAPVHAGGGRACSSAPCFQRAIRWHEANERHLRRELAVRYVEPIDVAFQLSQAIYGMPASEARIIGTCESNLDPAERNSQTATGVMQELDSTFNRTPFARIRLPSRLIASFDTFVNILAAGYIWRQDGGSFREWDCSRITGVR